MSFLKNLRNTVGTIIIETELHKSVGNLGKAAARLQVENLRVQGKVLDKVIDATGSELLEIVGIMNANAAHMWTDVSEGASLVESYKKGMENNSRILNNHTEKAYYKDLNAVTDKAILVGVDMLEGLTQFKKSIKDL